MKKIIPLALASAFFLAGCASSIHTIGNNVYVASKTGGGFSSTSGLLDDLYEDAAKFCAEKGGEFNLLDQGAQAGNLHMYSPGANASGTGFAAGLSRGLSIPMGTYPQATIRFTCERKAEPSADASFPADRYLYEGEEKGFKIYLRLDKMERGQMARMYRLVVMPQPTKGYQGKIWRSAEDETVIDCRNKSVNIPRIRMYGTANGEGEVLWVQEQDKDFRKYEKGSYFEAMAARLCTP
jgi:hypothetical protein